MCVYVCMCVCVHVFQLCVLRALRADLHVRGFVGDSCHELAQHNEIDNERRGQQRVLAHVVNGNGAQACMCACVCRVCVCVCVCVCVMCVPLRKMEEVYSSMARLLSLTKGTYLITTY